MEPNNNEREKKGVERKENEVDKRGVKKERKKEKKKGKKRGEMTLEEFEPTIF